MNDKLYWYSAKVVSVYDGDTIRVDIDLGFGVFRHRLRIRLARVSAPEVRGKDRKKGLAVRDFLRSLLPLGSSVFLRTYRGTQGKYGRYIAEVYLADGVNVNDLVIDFVDSLNQR